MVKERWDRVILREICDSVNYGYTASAKTEPIGPKFLRITDIVPNQIDWSSVPHCKINEKDIDKYRLEKGDIVIARTGATTGYAKRIRDDYTAVFASYLVRIRVNSKYDSQYVGFVIESDEYKQFIQLNLEGTAQPQANAQVLTSFPIPLPPLDTQRKIAALLSTLDDKIELNRQMNETLAAMVQAIFKSWFVNFDPVRAKMEGRMPTGMDAATATLFPSAFQDSPLGKIPESWKVGTLGEIAKNVRHSVKAGEIDSDEFYIGLEHMPRRSIALSEWQTADGLGSNKYRFRKGEILFGKLRPYFHKVGVAPLDGVCSTDILVIQPIDSEWFGVVLGFVSSDEFIAYTNAYSTGTRMPRTNWKDMSMYEIVLPPIEVSQKYTEFIRPFIERIIENIHQSRTLSQIRDTLLPKLISGELDISNLDIDTG